MTNTPLPENEYRVLIDQKLELYRDISDRNFKSVQEEIKTFREASDRNIKAIERENKVYQESIRAEIKAYQDANKQQLNVSLGVLVTSAIAVLVSAVLSVN